jgi:hypothetical protein
MADFLEQKRKEITDRMAELEPQIAEYRVLKEAANALNGLTSGRGGTARGATAAEPSAPRRGPGRPRGSRNRATATATTTPKATRKRSAKGRPGRRKGTGKRSAETLALIQAQPGITVPELATKMDIKQNYLYRVLPGLEQEGKVDKQGRGWHPKMAGR